MMGILDPSRKFKENPKLAKASASAFSSLGTCVSENSTKEVAKFLTISR